jgi:hypothetical protein
MSLAMDYPNPQRDRANLSRDGSTLRSSRRGDPRSEHSGPVPIAPMVAPPGPVPTVSTPRCSRARSAVRPRVRQRAFDRSVGSRLHRRGREGQPAQECNDRRAHFSLHRERGAL